MRLRMGLGWRRIVWRVVVQVLLPPRAALSVLVSVLFPFLVLLLQSKELLHGVYRCWGGGLGGARGWLTVSVSVGSRALSGGVSLAAESLRVHQLEFRMLHPKRTKQRTATYGGYVFRGFCFPAASREEAASNGRRAKKTTLSSTAGPFFIYEYFGYLLSYGFANPGEGEKG